MAEWTGRKRRQHAGTSTEASRRHQDRDDTPLAPETPGAQFSPQHPGEVPDRSTVPGQFSTRVARATDVRRPLTEYGTAQAIMDVYKAAPGEEGEPSRFEQATASFEELRKAYPAQVPPVRPAPGYALQHGDAMASELQAIDGARPALPEATTAGGEAHNAQPGGSAAPPARADVPPSQVGSAFSPSDAPASVRSPADALAGSGAATEPKRGGDDTAGAPAGQSRWAEAAGASPGDASSPAGTLPGAKDGETINEGGGTPPPVAAQ